MHILFVIFNTVLNFLSPWIDPATVLQWIPTVVALVFVVCYLTIFHRRDLRIAAPIIWRKFLAVFRPVTCHGDALGKESSPKPVPPCTGLPAAVMVAMPGDPQPHGSLPAGASLADALQAVANVGQQAIANGGAMPGGMVILNGNVIGQGMGFKIQPQPPRQHKAVCGDPFCWNADDEDCIIPEKVDWLKNRLQFVIDQSLATGKN